VPSDELSRALAAEKPVAPMMLVFDGALLDQMRPLAQRIRAAGRGVTARRGVLWHTDVVTLGLDPADAVPTPRRESRDQRRVFLDDGHLAGVSHSPVHWELARFLAGRVDGSPAARQWVADWYRATVAFLQREQQYGSEQVREALRIAPGDARLQLLAGGEHEALASPPVQSFVETTTRLASMTLPVESATRELAEAQRFFSTALALDPRLVEARVRLGRVLALRGRIAEAITQLRQASLAETEPLIRFYGFLFLGSALEKQRDYPLARDAYTRALDLFPHSRSANLALARLEWRFGDAEAMTGRLTAALDPADGTGDPWQTYHLAHGRDAGRLLQHVRDSELQ
jgi:tetratricopeptide (TPR) repeat protein